MVADAIMATRRQKTTSVSWVWKLDPNILFSRFPIPVRRNTKSKEPVNPPSTVISWVEANMVLYTFIINNNNYDYNKNNNDDYNRNVDNNKNDDNNDYDYDNNNNNKMLLIIFMMIMI